MSRSVENVYNTSKINSLHINLSWESLISDCLKATSLFVFCIQAIPLLDRLTPALACPWPCPHLGISPSTTPIPPTPQPISPPSLPPTPSTTATRAWSIAARLSWPTPTHGRRALAACCRLKARRARMVSRNRYLSVCSSVCSSAGPTSLTILEVCLKIGCAQMMAKYIITRLERILTLWM